MGSLPDSLAEELRREVGLVRAVETGTYGGGTALILARMFPQAFTVELSEELHRRAAAELAGVSNLTLLHGSSPDVLTRLDAASAGTLYWLDAHWSGGETAGRDNPCPVIEEIRAIGAGHPDDCLLIDDARLFNDPGWPSLLDVMNAIRAERPGHHVAVAHDLIVAVPGRARRIVDAFAKRHDEIAVRAAEEGRLGPRRARVNRLLVHPAVVRLVQALVRIKRRLTLGGRAAPGE